MKTGYNRIILGKWGEYRRSIKVPDTKDVKLKKPYFTGFSEDWKEKVRQKYNNFFAFGAT